jgi:exocyst complex component 2
MLASIVHSLDDKLFDGYIQPRVAVVMEHIRTGVLDEKMDWYDTPPPTGELLLLNLNL